MFSIKDKIILISGGNRGLGRGIALGLAQQGAEIVIAARDEKSLLETKALITREGHTCHSLLMDVSIRESVTEAVESVLSITGRAIDVLINNAGMSVGNVKAEDMTETDWLGVMDVNLNGYFRLGRAVAQKMIPQRAGKIINLSSVLGITAAPLCLAYCASKGAVNQLTKAWAVEWARYNIQVNALAPAFIITDLNRVQLQNQKFREKILSRIPAGRLGEVHDLIGAIAFLASEASNYVTGVILPVDGGWCAG